MRATFQICFLLLLLFLSLCIFFIYEGFIFLIILDLLTIMGQIKVWVCQMWLQDVVVMPYRTDFYITFIKIMMEVKAL